MNEPENAAMTEYTRPIAARGGHLWHTDGTCSHCGADANKAVEDAKRYQAIWKHKFHIYPPSDDVDTWMVGTEAECSLLSAHTGLSLVTALDAAIDAALSRTTAPSLDEAVDKWRAPHNAEEEKEA